ncbi:protein MpLTPG2 [Marchantia polymorpha subsp. ruderalis]|uniref:Bifunctional inhibitor/plant lipid transfer protein/seed storage helical domain-containing protein n=2 Tax=Marchantia polymorpha TaxID=3197 RepID=A0AAF6ASS1_MARPO|nr:hypothetical protein MARPO_0001s0495 [Marchantia polymorpha]BBM99491.1 hypothetical protein Mp_1g21600 [Marchantia polymorpha subsp. ruderalis]|eukprot:PTQ50574.1 hypothetical protein MARPO_0001s0495 [Marchantia polymorpha]
MMRRPHFIVVAALLLLAAFCRPSLTAEVKPDCSEQVVQLAPCLSYVSGDDPKPPEDCCDALTTVVVETPTCICEIIEGGENATASTGLLAINLTLVKQLPKECGVQEQIKIDESHCPGFGNQTLAPPSGPGVTSAPAQESAAVLRGQSIPSSFVWSLIISVGLWVRRP